MRTTVWTVDERKESLLLDIALILGLFFIGFSLRGVLEDFFCKSFVCSKEKYEIAVVRCGDGCDGCGVGLAERNPR